ncbi:2-oxo-4-hydroxy-4-carboxy-5-ureidoimidazoline decarboxylase [Halalkalibacterium halodurans]|uniref:2-oxo-4-hydroxy-4-carboxy-5-ureidoimidazoline decarboxylase n=1 Tax=Halalkalibacterium halodurans TaxID=86665 RepID=UPI001FBA6CF6|nr:2-oxo-4-hydroxy-4-carboxy-5-ureidoimidazoline decarboxylase [Halalkalibacterium halodurans]
MKEVNEMSKTNFVDSIGSVFEHSPWVAEKAWMHHPFSSLEQMYQKMIEEMYAADPLLQLALLRAHPDLGTRMEISETSTNEQLHAGLSQLSEEEFNEFSRLNKDYVQAFSFPFIMAVRGQDKNSIKQSMKKRIANSYEAELQTALNEVSKIVKFRLLDMVRDEETLISEY